MDQLGDLHLSSCVGYNAGTIGFLENSVICYIVGNTLKFVNVDTNETKYLHSAGDGIFSFAVNPQHNCVAFSDNGLENQLFIYSFDKFDVPELTLPGFSLGYSCLSFSHNGNLLAGCSTIPDTKLFVWNWLEGSQLCSVDVDATLQTISFNPANWRYLCGIDDNKLHVWNLEHINNHYWLHLLPIIFPYEDGTFGLEDTDMYSQTEDDGARLVPRLFCWLPDNNIFTLCQPTYAVVVNVESKFVKCLQKDRNVEDVLKSVLSVTFHKHGVICGTAEGDLLTVEVKDNSLSVTDRRNVNSTSSIQMLSSSVHFQKLAIGTENGSIHISDGNTTTNMLVNHENGKIVGIENLSDGCQHFVTCRSFGLLQVWTLKLCENVGSLLLTNYQISCLCVPSSSNCVYLGTSHGSVVVVDVTKPTNPSIIFEKYLHESPLIMLAMDESGSILVSGSSDGHVYIMNGRISSHLDVLGYIDVNGSVTCGSVRSLREKNIEGPWKVLIGVSSSNEKLVCNQLVEMTVTQELLAGISSLFMDKTKLLKDVSINKKVYLLKSSIYDIVIASKDTAFAVLHQNKKIAKFFFDEKENTLTNMVIEASSVFPGHFRYGGKICLSNHGKWLLTSSQDGYICIRAIGAMGNPVWKHVSNYRTGGLSHAVFSNDAQTIICASSEGCVSSWQWQFTALGKSKASSAIDAYRAFCGAIKPLRERENEFICQADSMDSDKEVEAHQTYLQAAIATQHEVEGQQYATLKGQLRKEFEALRSKVLGMIVTNETLPDIEKLDRQQFNMDLEERQQLIKDRENTLKKIRAEIDLENTSKRFQHYLIQQECWDGMETKGKSVASINTILSVSNYPIPKLSEDEEKQYEHVIHQRQLENVAKKVKEEILHEDLSSKMLTEKLSISEREDDESKTDEYQLSSSVYGSMGFKCGGYNPLLHSQFTLRTKTQKNHQIILIQRCIRQIKESFNKSFESVYANKLNVVRRMNDRNNRIRKILNDMDVTETIVEDIKLKPIEQPESFLIVDDSEVKVEKYISEEERKRLEEEKLLEEQRRLANTDDGRSRALGMMMAGRLETNLEEELKKDIEQPSFMKEKPQEDWDEEEMKIAKEYEKKIIELEEEREKYRKTLEGELKKLQATNAESAISVDEKILDLFQSKIRLESVILQEELKVVRITASLLHDEQLEWKEKNLLFKLEALKEEKQKSSLSVGDAKREVELFRDEYETLFADDKTLEKTFRKEFPELDAHTIDMLYKMFKRRPRAQRTLKAAAESQSEITNTYDENPFKLRPSSSKANRAAAQALEKAMIELDDFHHMPENVDEQTWEKLVVLRRNKVEREQQLKTKALVLAELTTHFQQELDRDEDLKSSIEQTFEEIQRVREERLRARLDLEVQLLVKQGQVEVEITDFVPSYENALLLHRSAVEDLNATILTLGRAKLASMNESKDFRKGIHQLEWQLKEMLMRAEDCERMAQDLQLLRVTKDLQVYLSDTDQRESKQQEIGSLEKRIESYKQMHLRKVHDKRRCIRKLRQKIRQKKDENSELDIKLEDLSLSLAERQSVENALNEEQGTSSSDRMKDIITRRKLVDIAKVQSAELGLLRAEVERLRMRTFPALLQLDYT